MNKDKEFSAINFTGLTHDHTSAHSNVRFAPAADHDHDHDHDRDRDDEMAERPAAPNDFCSAISILKRHPMYDCLLLVKKYRDCLAGYSLEFPLDRVREHERIPTNESAGKRDEQQQQQRQPEQEEQQEQEQHELGRLNTSPCSQQRLVSRFLDGDDPMYQAPGSAKSDADSLASGSTNGLDQQQENNNNNNSAAAAATAAAMASQNQENEARAQLQAPGAAELPFALQLDDRGDRCELVHVPVNGLLDRLENYTRAGIAVDSRVYAFAMGLKTAERMMTTKSMKELQETPI